MTEKSQWYYVENQDRKGPVTISAIRQLAEQGVITDQTLVWKEGMKDWEPAGAIKGLVEGLGSTAPKVAPIAAKPRTPPAPQTAASDSSTTKPAFQNLSAETSSSSIDSPVTVRPTPVSVNPATTTVDPGEIKTAAVSVQAAPSSAASRTRLSSTGNLMQRFQFIGYPCLVAGFLLVIGSKGCDSLGNRWVNRLTANSQIAEDKFNYSYDRKKNSLQSQIDGENDADDPNPERISDLNKRIADLSREQASERQRLMKTTWFELNASARTARANNMAWGFFREMGFVFGSMVLSIGLLVLGITGNTSEKWTCLIMLAIITFSLYIGGFAWFSSIAGNLSGVM